MLWTTGTGPPANLLCRYSLDMAQGVQHAFDSARSHFGSSSDCSAQFFSPHSFSYLPRLAMSFVQELFDAVKTSLEGSTKEVRGKRQRTSPSGGSTRPAESKKDDLTPSQISEVSELIQGGMNGLAQVVGAKLQQQGARLDSLEKAMDDNQNLTKKVISDVQALDGKITDGMEEMKKNTEEMRQLINATKKMHIAAPADSNAGVRPATSSQTAGSCGPRTVARMGNLGFDTPGAEIVKRAKEALIAANVPAETCGAVAAVRRDQGSAAEIVFMSEQALKAASIAVRAQELTYVPGKYVWVNVAQTREERKPARIVHRMHDCLVDMEKLSGRGLAVVKNVPGKYVTVGNDKVGFSLRGEWKWTAYATSRYHGQELDDSKAYAEDQ